MPRMTVKLLLVDEDDRLLLLRATEPATGEARWYPVGGGIEEGETLAAAAAREAYEETGLTAVPHGAHVWTREHTYRFDGRTVEVHEDWLLVPVRHFEPLAAGLSAYEERTLSGHRWWPADELMSTTQTVFPPDLGDRLSALLRDGVPPAPIDISDRSAS